MGVSETDEFNSLKFSIALIILNQFTFRFVGIPACIILNGQSTQYIIIYYRHIGTIIFIQHEAFKKIIDRRLGTGYDRMDNNALTSLWTI